MISAQSSTSLELFTGRLTQNFKAQGLTTEQILSVEGGPAYVEHLIKHRYENFSSRIHRHEITCSDPIARFICDRYIDEVLSKPLKFYDIYEADEPEEIMQDVSVLLQQIKFNEIIKQIYAKCGPDGYAITQMKIGTNGFPFSKVYGFFESPPDYWKRFKIPKAAPPYMQQFHNTIKEYYAEFIPCPAGQEYMYNYNIHPEEEFLYPGTDPNLFHFTRGAWNYGVGMNRIQGVWASMVKLGKISHADYKRSSIFNILQYPEDMDPKDAERLIEGIRNVDEMNGIALPMKVSEDGTVQPFPAFFDRTMDQQGAMPKADASSGGALLNNPEYARILIDLGYTQSRLVGAQEGALEGSKLDWESNDQVDMREFQHVKPWVKDLLIWYAQNGFLEGIEGESLEHVMQGDYDVKCHVEYTVIENRAKDAEMQQAEQAEANSEMKTNARSRLDDENADATDAFIINCIRNNYSSGAMMPVQSSWIESVGVKDKMLWIKIPKWTGQKTGPMAKFGGSKGPYAGWKFDDPADAENLYWKMKASSPGKTIWNEIWAEGTKPFSYGPRDVQSGIEKGWHYQNDPFGGATPNIPSLPSMPQPTVQPNGFMTPVAPTTAPTTIPGAKPSVGGIPYNETTGPQVGDQTTPYAMEYDWNYESNPKSVTGTTRHGKGRKRSRGANPAKSGKPSIRPVNYTKPTPPATHNSLDLDLVEQIPFERVNSILKDLRDTGMSKSTWIALKKILPVIKEKWNYRNNSKVVSGNPMNFDLPLQYSHGTEFACKKEWKKIIAHEGPLYLYKSLAHEGERVNVGTYKYWWDEKKDGPVVQYDKNLVNSAVKDALTKWNLTNNSIYDKTVKGLLLNLSTEYYCNTKRSNDKVYQTEFHDGNGTPKLKAIAVVSEPNCGEPFCHLEEEEVEEEFES